MYNNIVSMALDRYIEEMDEPRENDGKYHPSSMYNCNRATILTLRGTIKTNPADAEAKRRFLIGHLLHRVVQAALPGHSLIKAVYPEFLVDVPEWNITGHGDVLVELADGSWIVVEIKSTKSLRYTPKDEHIKQGATYFVVARDYGVTAADGTFIPPLGDKLTGLMMVYLEKSNLEIREYFLTEKSGWRKMVEDLVTELDTYRLGGGLPPALPKQNGKPHWFTNYCEYKGSGRCCGDKEGEFEW